MKKTILIFIITFTVGCKDYHECSELTFSNNLFLLDNKPYSGNCVSELHINDNKKTIYLYKNGIQFKKLEYFTDGITVINERNINGDDWSFTDYFLDGKIKKTGQVSNFQVQGEWIEYHENGKPKIIRNYLNGYEDGKYTEYYKNGNIKVEKNYLNNELNGKYIKHDTNGLIVKEDIYKKGKWINNN